MTDQEIRRNTFPEFMKMVDLVTAQNMLQRKKIRDFIDQQDAAYWTFAEDLCRVLNHALLETETERREAARAYNQLCMDLLREQIRFRKCGVYRLSDSRSAEASIYSRPDVMRFYIIGLLLSYLFWPNHYRMFCFFQEHLAGCDVRRCLEVGGGHGLFTAEVLRRFPHSRYSLIDISQSSLELTQDMLRAFEVDPFRVAYRHGDFLSVPLDQNDFDFIVMGEVLEHVNDARGFLMRARQLLQSKGAVFLSTCANCPAPDHVYHFHTVKEIRDLIQAAGLSIVKDLALPVEPVPEELWEQEAASINYCAVLAQA